MENICKQSLVNMINTKKILMASAGSYALTTQCMKVKLTKGKQMDLGE